MNHEYENIAIIRLSSLGDIIHTLPAFYLIREQFPESRISWFVEPSGASLLEHFTGIDEIVVINLKAPGIKKKVKEIKRIKRHYARRFDLIIDFQGLLKSAVLALILKSHTIGFHKKNLKEPLAVCFYHRTARYFDEDQHVIYKNMNLLERIDIKDKRIRYPLKKLKASAQLDHFLKNQKLEKRNFLLFNIGGGWESKIFPVESYIGMVNELTVNHPVVILWGNGREKKIAAQVCDRTGAIMGIPTDFSELIFLIERADILVSGDTLALHLADMVRTPSVGLFGPTNPTRNGSLLTESRSLYRKMDCGFCYLKKCDTIECLKAITPAEVKAAVENIHAKQN